MDSGVGGLTVVKEVMRQLPLERIIYFGDTLRAPYGPRPSEEVRQFTRQIVDYLFQYDPKMDRDRLQHGNGGSYWMRSVR